MADSLTQNEIRKRLTRSEKMGKIIEEFKIQLDERKNQNDITNEEYNIELAQFIMQTRKKYKKIKKGKIQRMEELKYEIIDNFKKEYPHLDNKEIIRLAQPTIDAKINTSIKQKIPNSDKNTKPFKKKRKTKTQRLDKRREEFINQLKKANPDISETQIAHHLEEYKKIESALLEDDITFNKKMIDAKLELEKKYGTDIGSMEKIKSEVIQRLVNEKRRFFGLPEKDTYYTTSEQQIIESEKERILSMKKSNDDIKQVENLIEKMEAYVSDNKSEDASNNTNTNVILGISNEEKLVAQYQKEMEEKYQDSKLLLDERRNKINSELQIICSEIKREIQLDRKVIIKKEELKEEMEKIKKYRTNPELLQQDLEKKLKKYKERQLEYLHMGIDPDKEDEMALNLANQIWKEVMNTFNQNRQLWNNMTAKQKIDPFIEKYKDFSTSYQIILKYMIFELQYSPIAFSRFLSRCRDNLPKPNAKHDEIQDVRFENQAKYVQYLYEENQKRKNQHINYSVARNIFNSALESLRKEKKEFVKKYDVAKNKLDNEKINRGKEIVSELITKIKSGNLLDDMQEEEAIELLEQVLKMQKEQQQSIDDTVKDSVRGATKIPMIPN